MCDLLEAGTLIVLGLTLYCGRFFRLGEEGVDGEGFTGASADAFNATLVVFVMVLHGLVVIGVVLFIGHHILSRSLNRSAGVSLGSELRASFVFEKIQHRFGTRVARVLTPMILWVDRRFNKRKNDLQHFHSALYVRRETRPKLIRNYTQY